MAGYGQRFVDEGYKEIKPLLSINGFSLLERVVKMFDVEHDHFVFIVNRRHIIEDPTLLNKIYNLCSNAEVIDVKEHRLGPVYTLLSIDSKYWDDEEVIISYCDNPFVLNYDNFKKTIKNSNFEGVIFSHTGFHPHRLSSTYMAYLKVSDNEELIEIQEKAPYTSNHWSEHASTGTYYFRNSRRAHSMMREMFEMGNCHSNGEYYVTLVYNLFVKNGFKIGSYLSDFVTVLGTPGEFENFKAWMEILKGHQIKSEDDLIKVYNYWKKYIENGNS